MIQLFEQAAQVVAKGALIGVCLHQGDVVVTPVVNSSDHRDSGLHLLQYLRRVSLRLSPAIPIEVALIYPAFVQIQNPIPFEQLFYH